MSKTAIFPGTFDPFTLGHLAVVNKVVKIFDHLTIGISKNSGSKHPWFSLEERRDIILEDLHNYLKPDDAAKVEVDFFEGLLVDYMRSQHIRFIVRGIRNGVDFEYESNMFAINKMLDLDDIEAIFILSPTSMSNISSSMVKEIASLSTNSQQLEKFVSPETSAKLLAHIQQSHQQA